MLKSDIPADGYRPMISMNESQRLRSRLLRCVGYSFVIVVVLSLIGLFLAVAFLYCDTTTKLQNLQDQISGYHSNDFLCSNNKEPSIDFLHNFGLVNETRDVQKTTGPRYGTQAFQIQQTANLQRKSKYIFRHSLPKSYLFQAEFRVTHFVQDLYLILVRNQNGMDQFVVQLTFAPNARIIFTTLDGNGRAEHKTIRFSPEKLAFKSWHILELKVTAGEDFREVRLYIDCEIISSQSMDFHGRSMDLDGDTRIFSQIDNRSRQFKTVLMEVHKMSVIY